jgi:hypothetical protein
MLVGGRCCVAPGFLETEDFAPAAVKPIFRHLKKGQKYGIPPWDALHERA